MKEQTYLEWAKYHSELFGMNSTGDLTSLVRWSKFFQLQGFDPAELFAASESIAANATVPKWRAEHFDALKAKLYAARARAKQQSELPKNYCLKCGDSGTVSVPNQEAIRRHGKYYSQIVACDCYRGDQWRSHNIMTLSIYSAQYPNWKSTIFEWRERDKEEMETQKENARLDNLFGSIIAKVVQKKGKE